MIELILAASYHGHWSSPFDELTARPAAAALLSVDSTEWSTPPLRCTPTTPGRPKTQKPLKSELSKQPPQSSSFVELTAKPAAALLSPLQ